MNGFGNKQGQVGWFSDAVYEDGTPVALVALVQEFGSVTNKIPPRSFMRTTIAEKRKQWALTAEQAAKALLRGSETPDTAMNKIALMAQGDVQKKITQIMEPPLKHTTVAARLRRRTKKTIGLIDKPLIDTGQMLNSLSSKVE